ncbi:MAG: GFA family protein [Pseudomonadota bacterium]|nr:GFA family protein [Pseudomonadota bacterium]
MTTRTASCRCGQLNATVTGEPVRISACHCLVCQQRTGSAFSVQARWPADQVTVEGKSTSWTRTADSGLTATDHFCPECGSTVHFVTQHMPDLVAIPVGAFADPAFPPPRFSVWEERKHPWVTILGDDVEHMH